MTRRTRKRSVAKAAILASLCVLVINGCQGAQSFTGKNNLLPSPTPEHIPAGKAPGEPFDSASTSAQNQSEEKAISASSVASQTQIRGADSKLLCKESSFKWNPQMRLLIPEQCAFSFESKTPHDKQTDLVFVIDTTGSMGSKIDAVHSGIRALTQIIVQKGWTLRAGAIAFADTILEEIPLTTDMGDLLRNMDRQRDAWRASPGFGGDEPEIGLYAIERGISLLGLEGVASGKEKVLVYVSDAPARRIDKGLFDIQATAQALRAYASQTSKGGSFRFFYSVDFQRNARLMDDMPTPGQQIESLISKAQIDSFKMPFPLQTSNVGKALITPLDMPQVHTENCAFQRAYGKSPSGQNYAQVTQISPWWLAEFPNSTDITLIESYWLCPSAGEFVFTSKVVP